MSSTITLKSKWQDKEWTPEPGSPMNPMRSYVLNGEIHWLSDEERQAGERVGAQTHTEYAITPTDYGTGQRGWEYFDARPGATQIENANGDSHWTQQQDALLIQLRRSGWTFRRIAVHIQRTEVACDARYRRIMKYI